MLRTSASSSGPFELFRLTNRHQMSVVISNLGGIIQSILVPDRTGNLADVVLGFPELETYYQLKERPYFGAIIGRYCNRIAKGTFEIEGKRYDLAVNCNHNHLHGGVVGFDQLGH